MILTVADHPFPFCLVQPHILICFIAFLGTATHAVKPCHEAIMQLWQYMTKQISVWHGAGKSLMALILWLN